MPDDTSQPQESKTWAGAPWVICGIALLFGLRRCWKVYAALTASSPPSLLWLGLDIVLAVFFLGLAAGGVFMAIRDRARG